MKTGQKYLLLLILMVIVSTLLTAQTSTPQITGVSTQSDGTVLINWVVGSENGINYYEIYRGTDLNGTFSRIGNAPKGTFYFIDKNDLFKTDSRYFCYKVTAVGSSSSQTSNVLGVLYNSTSSAPKRTWGSIKAMFR
jgi:fibronectin type 3 domain-containing protein